MPSALRGEALGPQAVALHPAEGANSEAARHRLARRAAETARDAALACLSAVQAREVERLAAE